ncbi:MAG: diguanylate cyclase [Gammaproteobacteria bacterium]|nr:diguanylate cyclase [Gammaproteobacteria bacterium]
MTIADEITEFKPTVLLVTQSHLSAKSIVKLLQSQFYVVEVDNEENAWQALTKQESFDLVVSDLHLLQTQFNLLGRLKQAQNEAIRNLPLLLLVAENDEDYDCEEALAQGASDFLMMPFSSSELLGRVRMHTNSFKRPAEITIDIENDDSVDILQQMTQERFFESRLEQELSFSSRHIVPVSSCKLEVNGLEQIEQQQGHKSAHTVIKYFAKVLKKTVRLEDTLSYSGHGRFSLLYPATNALGALAGIKRIRKATDEMKVKLADDELNISFCASIYTSLASGALSVEDVQDELDERLDEALKKGNGEIVTSGQKAGKELDVSLERALTLIEKGETKDLAEHSKKLMQKIIPIMRFTDAQLSLGMEKVIESLIERIKKR